MMHAEQLLLDLPLKPNYSEADFVKSPCNAEAIQLIECWPDWPMKMIAIYGELGCGKTHLAHIWERKTGALYLSPSDIQKLSPIEAIKNHEAFILDDADSLFTQDSISEFKPEDWMFHFYNLVKEKGSDLLICSHQPPTQWFVKLPDLRSRLSTILSVAVKPPDENALKAVLLKLCHERGMILNNEVADYILRRIERSFEGIINIVSMLDHKTLALHRQLTLGLARELLNETITPTI